jgi:aminobenzoyl-glutamate utilization protein A
MSQQTRRDRLVTLRRELHRHPEPAWREFYTTARIVEELEDIGVDEIHAGPDAIAADERMGVPEAAALDEWLARARERWAAERDSDRSALFDRMAGGRTGAVAVLRRGEGPTVGLRVDIDGLPQPESIDDDHRPASEGFRSETGAMHACGHDAHTTIGIGVLEAIKDSEFAGTLKLFFQPAEEVVGGGKPMAESGHLDDVDYLLAVHVGLDHPTGEVVAGIDGFLAVTGFDVTFTGAPAHAGMRPAEGTYAVQAMATAVQNLYGIPRHGDGATRVNAGVIEGGTASNIVAEEVRMEAEVRGETTALKEYMADRAEQVIESAAEMHGCAVEREVVGEAPSAESDDALIDLVGAVAADVPGVERVLDRDRLGGSEDATYLMQRVQAAGGMACYAVVGTDHPGGHHTATFDVDEDSLEIGVATLAGAVERIARDRP